MFREWGQQNLLRNDFDGLRFIKSSGPEFWNLGKFSGITTCIYKKRLIKVWFWPFQPMESWRFFNLTLTLVFAFENYISFIFLMWMYLLRITIKVSAAIKHGDTIQYSVISQVALLNNCHLSRLLQYKSIQSLYVVWWMQGWQIVKSFEISFNSSLDIFAL